MVSNCLSEEMTFGRSTEGKALEERTRNYRESVLLTQGERRKESRPDEAGR